MVFLDLDKEDVDLINTFRGYHEWANSYLRKMDIHSAPLKGNKEWEQFILCVFDLFIEFDKKIRTEYSREAVDALIDSYAIASHDLVLGFTAIGGKETALMVLLLGKNTYMEMATKYDKKLLELFEIFHFTEKLEKKLKRKLKRKYFAKEESSGKYFKAIFYIILIILAIKFFMS